jgi:hypothetical protein
MTKVGGGVPAVELDPGTSECDDLADGGQTQLRHGELYEKHGAYYGRWRTSDDRKLNPKVGSVRTPGSADGLTRAQAERAFRKLQEAEERRPSRRRDVEPVTVGAAATSLRQAKSLEGARKSYLEGLESMQRVHLEATIAAWPLERVSTARIEAMATAVLDGGLAPKTVRNALTFAHSVFEHAIAKGWCHENPVRYAARPKRRRARDASPDLQFLTVSEPCGAMKPGSTIIAVGRSPLGRSH